METLAETNMDTAGTQADRQPVLLFVDDEVNILSSLRRLFRPQGYQVLTAESAAMALEILQAEPVDLVISDMRMPGMNGAEFLAQVRQRWPEIPRILLTGYAELGATIQAINDGGIYRYVAKPWDDNDIVLTVAGALEKRQLERDKARLEALTRTQNDELKQLNSNLEITVQARTEELRQTVLFLENAQDRLKKNIFTMLKVFSNLLELRGGNIGSGNRVGELARRVARKLGQSDQLAQELMIAGLLHDIGKIGLPDEILAKPFDQLTPDERNLYARHPEKGQMALMPIEQMAAAGKLIRHQHERYDGKGFPDGLAGEQIPLGGRILMLVVDFEALLNGSLIGHVLKSEEALQFLRKYSKSRYDPAVLQAFEAVLAEPDALLVGGTQRVDLTNLKPGMKLAEDLRTPDGVLLLSHDHVLNAAQIQQIQRFAHTEGKSFPVVVYTSS